MSVDCRLTLPPAVRVHNVATVIGLAAGLPRRMDERPMAVRVPVEVVSSGMPNCCYIRWLDPVCGGQQILYHFEWGAHPGCHGMLPASTPFNICLCRKLVDFFGGVLDYADCDDEEEDYAAPFSIYCFPTDETWDAFQQRLWSVQPITEAEIEAMRYYAAYDKPR